jgi:hypothetical protein
MNRSTIVLGREEPGTQETYKVGPPVPPAHEVQEQVEHILGSDESCYRSGDETTS